MSKPLSQLIGADSGIYADHPLAGIFPLMTGQAADDLAIDIAAHGLREPIALLDGMILDGRNRYRACIQAGVEPRFWTYVGDDPRAFVVSVNLHRRHLDESQRALVAKKLANLQDGQRRDLAARSANLPTLGAGPPPAPPVSQAEAAKLLNVSERLVREAGAVLKTGVPELIDAVERGQAAVSAAAVVARQPAEKQQEIVRQGPSAIAAFKKAVKTAALGDNADLPSPKAAKEIATKKNIMVLGSDHRIHPPQNPAARQMALDVQSFGDPVRALNELTITPSRAFEAMTETDRKVLGPMIKTVTTWLQALGVALDAQ